LGLRGIYSLNLETHEWILIPSLTNTTNIDDRPDIAVCFCSMTKVDQNTILLVGGRRLSAMSGKTAYGVMTVNDSNNLHSSKMVADNMHVFNIQSKSWNRLMVAGSARPLWGHTVHVIGIGKVLVFGGAAEHASGGSNAIGIFEWESQARQNVLP
jgi:hypothetical protein